MRPIPELPPGYRYERISQHRVYIHYPHAEGITCRIRKANGKAQYWICDELAALAAWKHAYERLKEEKA